MNQRISGICYAYPLMVNCYDGIKIDTVLVS